jgi:hypothetical protein
MTTMARRITGGVDTHLDVHVAAALDGRGSVLGARSFATTPAGHRALLGWLKSSGTVELVGVEGAGRALSTTATAYAPNLGNAPAVIRSPERTERWTSMAGSGAAPHRFRGAPSVPFNLVAPFHTCDHQAQSP